MGSKCTWSSCSNWFFWILLFNPWRTFVWWPFWFQTGVDIQIYLVSWVGHRHLAACSCMLRLKLFLIIGYEKRQLCCICALKLRRNFFQRGICNCLWTWIDMKLDKLSWTFGVFVWINGPTAWFFFLVLEGWNGALSNVFRTIVKVFRRQLIEGCCEHIKPLSSVSLPPVCRRELMCGWLTLYFSIWTAIIQVVDICYLIGVCLWHFPFCICLSLCSLSYQQHE